MRVLESLFSPNSLYRTLAAHAGQQRGHASIVEHFHRLRWSKLHEAWLTETPAQAQEWGKDPAVSQFIHTHLASVIRAPAIPAALDAEDIIRPSAFCVDRMRPLTSEGKGNAVEARYLYTGGGTINDESPDAWTSTFEQNLTNFEPSSEYLSLIVTAPWLERLAEVLELPRPTNSSACLNVIAAALNVAVDEQQPNMGTEATEQTSDVGAEVVKPEIEVQERSKSQKVEFLLGMLPSIMLGTDWQGNCNAVFDLGLECPKVEPFTWLVLIEKPGDGEDF